MGVDVYYCQWERLLDEKAMECVLLLKSNEKLKSDAAESASAVPELRVRMELLAKKVNYTNIPKLQTCF